MEMPHLKAGPLTLEIQQGQRVARLVESEFPQYLRLTFQKLDSMEMSDQAARVVDKIRIMLANGWAVYLILRQQDDGFYLELVDSEMTEA